MNFLQMIESNVINPLPIDKFYYARKRIFHKGYEVLIQSPNGVWVHVQYTNTLEYKW